MMAALQLHGDALKVVLDDDHVEALIAVEPERLVGVAQMQHIDHHNEAGTMPPVNSIVTMTILIKPLRPLR